VRWRGPAAASASGFTLLELILVMVIICMVLGMAAPSLRNFFASRQTADAAAQLVALAEYARSQAVAEGRPYRLNLDLDAGTYWLTAQEQGAYEDLASEFGRVFHLPEGVAATWIGSAAEAPPQFIAFLPDGRNQAVGLRLSGRQGEVFDVVCPSPTETFRVEIPEEEGSD